MASSEKRTFSLPVEQGSYIDSKVESGSYGSASEVVRAGLRALMERDEVIEKWLREKVVPAIIRHDADPSRALPVKEAFDRVRSEYGRRKKKSA